MQEFLEFLKGFNIQTIISMFLMLWYFSHHIKSKLERHAERTDKLYEMFIQLRNDLSDYRKESDQKFYDLLKDKR